MRLGAAAMGIAGCCLFAGNSQAGPDQVKGGAMVELERSSSLPMKDKNLKLKEDVVRYEKDAEYMALNRNLLPEYPRQKRVAKKPRDNAGTIQVRDKPLVLGSRGLEIKSFEAQSYIKLEFDFYHHLQKHYPIPAPSVPEEKIDTQAEYAKYTKEFIFHPTSLALNRLKQVDFQEPEPQEEMVSLEKIQETHLRLSRKRPTQLILHRSDKALDLLYGNESVNRNAFQKW
jgi:hypothetical protein